MAEPDAGAGERPAWELLDPVGRLVEVHGMASEVLPNEETRLCDPAAEPLDLNGQRGRCLAWDPAEAKYVVHTFEGVLAGVPYGHLSELEPLPPEQGGFDVAWPGVEPAAREVFADTVGECLASRGYCVAQLFTARSVRESAREEARRRPAFERLRAEFAEGYLGTDSATTCGVLDTDLPDRVPVDGLAYCDQDLTSVGQLIAPVASEVLGFGVYGRTSAIVRATPAETVQAQPLPTLGDDELHDGRVESFIAWLLRRRLCLLYLIDNSGGTLELFPKEHLQMKPVRLPLQRSRLVLFRHDLMSYSYLPAGDSVALQAWLLDAPQHVEFRQMARPPGPQCCTRIHLTAAMEYFPANAQGGDMTLESLMAGTDCIVETPKTRFDKDLYCFDGQEGPVHGKAYIMHGSFLSHEVFIGFDSDFFGYNEEEVYAMSPSQRWVLEVGYQVLHNAGWAKLDLMGQRIGCFLGDSGDEWHQVYMRRGDRYRSTLKQGSVTPCRLGHILGLTGPCVGTDTACSASLVAFNTAAHLMKRSAPWSQPTPGRNPLVWRSADEVDDKAICGGIMCLMHPRGWIIECSATMLSYSGRCFTFNAGADGFIRGEGCCLAYARSMEDGAAAAGSRSLAVIMGSCANQDGRSASLTAPHGPSQTECIRATLMEALLEPADISAAECHGTGTALGDPIEVGAVRSVMLGNHPLPLLHSAAKGHCGHEEANAGATGLLKVVMMLNAGVSTPTPHLRVLNPHLDVGGYPVLFTAELTETRLGSQCMGVSSFGFGGTNARAELWSDTDRGLYANGQRAVLSREECVAYIQQTIDSTGTEREADMLVGRKRGHGQEHL